MTSFACELRRSVLLAVVVGLLAVSGCGSPVICSCPSDSGYTAVPLTAAQASPIATVSAGGGCTASSDSTGKIVAVYTSTAGTCAIRAQLANGDTYAFSVQFVAMTAGNECKCSLIRQADASAPELVDAGAD